MGNAVSIPGTPAATNQLSPDERDAELTGPRGATPDAPGLGDLVLRARLLEKGLHDVQAIDPPRRRG